MPTVESSTEPKAQRHVLHSGFWMVAFSFLIVMAFATLPSPLYGLYRTRDNLSAFTITVIYAIFAAGAIAALVADRFVVTRFGRRGTMLSAVATMVVAAALLAAWKDLPGLLIGRLLTGVAAGLAAGTATVYLMELRVRSNPKSDVVWARNVGTSVNVGALGIGPLIAGCLAEWVRWPLTLPYLIFLGLGSVALIGLTATAETGQMATQKIMDGRSGGSRRSVRPPVPAAAAALTAFAANGLFAGLSGLFLATTFHHPSHALAGATLFLVFSCGVVSQLATSALPASRVLALGTISMLAGLALLVTSVLLSTPNLALFLIGGALIGAGAGAVFKGTTGLVLDSSAPEDRVVLTSDLLIALLVGLSVPVIGAGLALNLGATEANTVLGFAVVVGVGISAAGWSLIGRPNNARRSAISSSATKAGRSDDPGPSSAYTP